MALFKDATAEKHPAANTAAGGLQSHQSHFSALQTLTVKLFGIAHKGKNTQDCCVMNTQSYRFNQILHIFFLVKKKQNQVLKESSLTFSRTCRPHAALYLLKPIS